MLFSKIKYPKSNVRSKKAALNLSVEAIIIFVLAFAMLGVGIFVTDQLRSIGTAGIEKSQAILDAIGETPTAENPIVGITSEFSLPVKKQAKLNLGYYNGMAETATEVSVIIDACKSTGTTKKTYSYANDGKYPVEVTAVSEKADVGPGEAVGILAYAQNNGLVSGAYICNLEIVKESAPATVYESMALYLNVIS